MRAAHDRPSPAPGQPQPSSHAHAHPAAHVGHAPAPMHEHGDGAVDKHAGHSVAMFRDKFWWSLLLTIPTLLWSDLLQGWFHYRAPTFPGSTDVPALFGTVVFFYGGTVFVQGAWRELRGRLPGMMTLISLAIGVAFLFSLAVTFGASGMALWC